MNNLELVLEAKKNNKIILIRDAVEDSLIPSWGIFQEIFEDAKDSRHMASCTFGTAGIDHAELISPNVYNMANDISSIHPGSFASALVIIHFLSANDNEIPDIAKSFYENFREYSSEEIPTNFESLMVPSRHSDPVDGVFVQCLGTTKWTAFYEEETESFIVKPGDIMYIPKGVEHSVETLEPRIGVSFGFIDPQ